MYNHGALIEAFLSVLKQFMTKKGRERVSFVKVLSPVFLYKTKTLPVISSQQCVHTDSLAARRVGLIAKCLFFLS